MADEPSAPDGSPEQIEELLGPVLDCPAGDQDRALAELAAAHPALADELRSRFEQYRELLHAVPPERRPIDGRFGEFELVRELGRGGMGVVYLARQERAGRDRLVALKVVRGHRLLSDSARERLHREAAVAFRLDDPGICPVFDVGDVDGVPWLSMRYVEGRTLAEHVADANRLGALDLPFAALRSNDDESTTTGSSSTGHRYAAVLMLGERLARALHTAHQAGFVHRDVKPGNVMITPQGQPVLLDFGLVLESSETHALTATGELLGTPAYMAPEQVEGRGPVGPAADVYSLAATLFEAIALRRPFEGSTRAELFANILQQPRPDLRRFAPGISRDLHLVFRTAMAREPEQRYVTALDFAMELRRVRRREPIVTRPPSLTHRMGLWAGRNRLAATLLVSLVVALGLALASLGKAINATADAQRNLAGARQAVAELVRVQHEELSDVPGLGPLRRDMQERALALLRDVRATAGDDPALAFDNAEALILGAKLELALGRPETSAAMQRESWPFVRDLGDSTAARSVRGYWWFVEGEREERAGRVEPAITAYQAAIAELTSGAAPLTDRLRAIRALTQIGDMHERQSDRDRAIAAVTRAIELGEGMPLESNASAITVLAGALRQRSELYRESDRLAEAEADLIAATTAVRALLGAGHGSRHARYRLSDCLISHATLLRRLGRDAERRTLLAEAVDVLESLAASFPSMASYRGSLAVALNNRAAQLAADGEPEAARASLRRAIAVLSRLLEESPENVRYRATLAQSHFNLGNRLRADRAAARPHFRAALAEIDRVIEQQPAFARHFEFAARMAMNLAIGHAIDGDSEAAAAFARARGYAETVLQLRPNDQRTMGMRGLLLFNEGAFRSDHGDFAAAQPLLEEAVAQAHVCFEAAPGNARRASDLVRWSTRCAQIAELNDGQGQDGTGAWTAADASWQRLPEPLQQRLMRSPDTALARLAVERALLAQRAANGDPTVDAELARISDHLAELTQHERAGGAVFAEAVCCLLDRLRATTTANERQAELRRALAAQLVAWPAKARPDGVTRARLERRAAELTTFVATDSPAHAMLERLQLR